LRPTIAVSPPRRDENLAERARPKYVVPDVDFTEREGSMTRFLVLAFVGLVPVASASSANAASERSFVGLWEGVDPVDGGDSLRSITCFEDRSCKLAATDSVVTLCGGGSAFVGGTGGLEGEALVFPDAVLTCPDDTTLDLAISFERDRRNRTLVETVVVDGGPTLPNIVFHKVSR
jgi:hypothetical protein